jgi:hypothetical protein
MWSHDFQKEMAARSMARPDALDIRSAGGKIGGRKRNEGIAIKPHERYMFSFKGEPILCVQKCSTGGDVLAMIKEFESKTDQMTKLDRVTGLLFFCWEKKNSVWLVMCPNLMKALLLFLYI